MACGAAGIVVAIVVAVQDFPLGLVVFACALAGVAAALYGILRRGIARAVGLGAGAALIAASIIVLLASVGPIDLVAVALLLAALALARTAFSVPREGSAA